MAKISTNAEINSIRVKEQAAAPDTPASGYGQIYELDDGKLYFKNDAGTEKELGAAAAAAAIYPQDVMVFANQFKSVAGTAAWAATVNTSQPYCFQYATGTGQAINDAVEAAVMLKAGTYDVTVLGITNTTRGIVKWSCDGTDFITGQDWYAGSLGNNVSKTGTLTVAADGRHLIRCTVTGKNASSTNYVMNFTYISFIAQTLASET